MARKNNLKSENAGSIHFDPQTKAVMATETQDHGIKEKVSAVREVIPGKSNNEIVLVLQYYDYDVEKAIQAYFDDGAKAALTEWHFPGNKAPNKKKKNKKAKASSSGQPVVANGAASGQRPHIDSNHTKEPLINGDILNHVSDEISAPKDQEDRLSASVANTTDQRLSSAPGTHQRNETSSESESHYKALPQRSNHRHDKHPGYHGHLHNEQGRQRTSSERSTTSIGSKENKPKKPFAGLERSTKDLHRQTTSLERLRVVLDAEFDKSYKRIQTVFDEARKALTEREVELIREMDNVKADANVVFSQRQEKAMNLKMRVERAERFTETELADLRADIKLFVSDRKVDEDLGRTTRFLYDTDRLNEVIKTFAEVVPVNCAYSARRPSLSSVGSSALSPEDTPTSLSFHKTANSVDNTESINELTSHDALSTEEMAELQHRLKNSLKLQGVPVKSPPPRNRPASAPVKPNSQTDNNKQNKNSQRNDQSKKDDKNDTKGKTTQSNSGETTQQDRSADRLNSGSRSPRRNYGRGQSSPQRFSADGRPRSERGQRGRGEGYRGRGGDGGRGRGRDRRGGRGRGDYRGGRGMNRGGASFQSSQATTLVTSATAVAPAASPAAAAAVASTT